jgi:hypothetical protein
MRALMELQTRREEEVEQGNSRSFQSVIAAEPVQRFALPFF